MGLTFFVYSNLLIALGGPLLAAETRVLAGLAPLSTRMAAFIFGGVLVIYLLDRIGFSGVEDDVPSDERLEWYRQNETYLWGLCIVGFIVAIWGFWYFPMSLRLFTGALATIPFLYVFPIAGRRLKSIPGMKIFVIALCWTGLTVWVPLFGEIDGYSSRFALLSLERFIFIYALTIPFEFKDRYRDGRAGIRTIAVLLGKWSRPLAIGLISVFALLVTLNYGTGPLVLALLLSAVVTAYFIWRDRGYESPMYYYFGLDGMLVLQPGLVLSLAYLF